VIPFRHLSVRAVKQVSSNSEEGPNALERLQANSSGPHHFVSITHLVFTPATGREPSLELYVTGYWVLDFLVPGIIALFGLVPLASIVLDLVQFFRVPGTVR